jgi:hypothetical protein
MRKFVFLIVIITSFVFSSTAGAILNHFWLDDFVGSTPGTQPSGWQDETDDNAFNVEIDYSYTTSYAVITRTAESTWGKVLSPQQFVDVDLHPFIKINIPATSGAVTWKLGIQEKEGSFIHYDIQGSTYATGEFTYDYATITGWSGQHMFSVEIILEGSAGEYIEVDYLSISGSTDDGFRDDLNGSAYNQPVKWLDETDDATFDCHIDYSYTASLAAITRTAENAWGKVLTVSQTLDVSLYPLVELKIEQLSDSVTWKLGIQEMGGTYQRYEIQASTTACGTLSYDYGSIIGWTGTHTFRVEIILEGSDGQWMELDHVRIYGDVLTMTPTNSPTFTMTPTPTFTPTRTFTATYSPTATHTPTDSITPSVTMTNTPIISATASTTMTMTATSFVSSTVTPVLSRTVTPSVTTTTIPSTTVTPTITITPTEQNRWRKAEVMVYPMPARGQVTFTYQIYCPVKVSIDIYSVTGERVARIEEEKQTSTAQDVFTVWNAVNVAPGIYLSRLVVRDMQGKVIINQRKKVAIIK